MVTALQPSCAVATPVALVLVLARHCRTRFGGAVIVGGFVSCTVIVWTALALLPHKSAAIQVRAMTLLLPQLEVTASLKATVTLPQLSWAVATPVTLVRVSAGHSRTALGGAVMVGGAVSP